MPLSDEQYQKIDWSKEGFDQYTFRAHSLGHIMTDPIGGSNIEKYMAARNSYFENQLKYEDTKNKETKTAIALKLKVDRLLVKSIELEKIKDIPVLSSGCMTHLCDIFTLTTTGRIEDIRSKYLEKGLNMEEDAITDYSLLLGKMFRKNTRRERNDFVEGHMDFEDDEIDCALDAKCNWTIYQFNRTKAKPIKPLYHWQLDAYMWLFNRSNGKLVYSLQNTPENLLKAEKKVLQYDFIGTEDEYQEACREIDFLHTYDDLDLKKKIKIFQVKRSEERIEKIKKRVLDCRWYLNQLLKNEGSYDLCLPSPETEIETE